MKNIICIFAKPPLPGKTKSRLAKSFSNESAAELSQIMLQSLIKQSLKSCANQVVLWGSPDSSLEQFKSIDFQSIKFENQFGSDLGERMANCFKKYLSNEKNNIILIGSDCISHTADLLNIAFDTLTKHDLIIQPACDGGYVLIGQRIFNGDIFENIPWGDDTVFSLTVDKLLSNKINYKTLPKAFDVDTKEDLNLLYEFSQTYSNQEILKWFQKYLPH